MKTVGALVTVIGGTLLYAGARGRVGPEVRLLGMGSAAAFTAIDILYTAQRRIPPVYLLDAVAESALIAGWSAVQARARVLRAHRAPRLGLRLLPTQPASA